MIIVKQPNRVAQAGFEISTIQLTRNVAAPTMGMVKPILVCDPFGQFNESEVRGVVSQLDWQDYP